MQAPEFWNTPSSWQSLLLAPLGWLYHTGVRLRWAFTTPQSVNVPVICVGNFTLGGGGKTPTVIAIAHHLKTAGANPFIISRGYGGITTGPHRVDPERDNAQQVGDEPLLLAQHAPVIVAADKVAGARHAILQGASHIVMDDGMQNPMLAKDMTLAVVDAQRGLGNGMVFPAGPLRAALSWQMMHVDAAFLVHDERRTRPHVSLDQLTVSKKITATLKPGPSIAVLKGQAVLGFCGLANPGKFRATLEHADAIVARFIAYPDHHPYSAADAKHLIALAAAQNLMLVTTQKDYARISTDPALRAQLMGLVNVVDVMLQPDDAAAFSALLRPLLSRPDDA